MEDGVSEDMLKGLELSLLASVTLERIMVLANEYNAKNITPERFAARTYELLAEYDKQAKETK
jgi:hypothetical protein